MDFEGIVKTPKTNTRKLMASKTAPISNRGTTTMDIFLKAIMALLSLTNKQAIAVANKNAVANHHMPIRKCTRAIIDGVKIVIFFFNYLELNVLHGLDETELNNYSI